MYNALVNFYRVNDRRKKEEAAMSEANKVFSKCRKLRRNLIAIVVEAMGTPRHSREFEEIVRKWRRIFRRWKKWEKKNPQSDALERKVIEVNCTPPILPRSAR